MYKLFNKRLFIILVLVHAIAISAYAGTTVYVTKTGKKFHKSYCSSLKRSKIAIDLEDAKARGYQPCKLCW